MDVEGVDLGGRQLVLHAEWPGDFLGGTDKAVLPRSPEDRGREAGGRRQRSHRSQVRGRHHGAGNSNRHGLGSRPSDVGDARLWRRRSPRLVVLIPVIFDLVAAKPVMSDLVHLFRKAVDEFGRRVEAVRPDQWQAPTPDTEWDVRALINHLVVECLWAPPLLDGLTLADVGDRFDGDQLGDEPQAVWRKAAAAAVQAVGAEGALERTVHVSFGDIPGHEYVSQLVCDHTIHAWDLAHAIEADERLDSGLVEFAHAYLAPQVDGWRAAGVFGPAVDVPTGVDRQSALLALSGRQA